LKICKVSLPETNNAFPTIESDNEGRIWIAWASCKDRMDDIYARFLKDGKISDAFKISTESGINFKPAIATDSQNRTWICWASRRRGIWGICARYVLGLEWSREMCITQPEMSASMPVITSDKDGRLWLAYEAFSNGAQHISVKTFNGKDWSQDKQISDGGKMPEYNYRPAITVDASNRVVVVWDAYRDGRYTILMRVYDGKWTDIIEAPGDNGLSRYFPHVAADRFGNVWISYTEQGEIAIEPTKTDMGPRSKVYLICWTNGEWRQTLPADDLSPGMISRTGHFTFVIVDLHDRPWIFWQQLPRHHNWFFLSRIYQGERWSEPVEYRYAIDFKNRDFQTYGMDFRGSATLDSEGNIWLVNEGKPAFDNNHIYVRCIENNFEEPISFPPHLVEPKFESVGKPARAVRLWKKYVIRVGNEEYSVFRGNIHVQTLISDGHSGTPDQFYTTAKEYYGWDLAAVTDHCDSIKWIQSEFAYSQRIATLFNNPPDFVGISGYEWTQGDYSEEIGMGRQGHRCILFETDDQPYYSPVDRSAKNIVQLSEALKKTNGLMSAHHLTRVHSGGTDFSYLDPAVEPNVEICSEWGIFEYLGNPGRIGPREVTSCSVQDALAMGHKLGMIAGSDSHDFCHLVNVGLTFMLLRKLTRGEIFEALRKRRVYASVGQEVFINFQVNGHIMGEEVKVKKGEVGPRKVHCEVEGPDKIIKVDVIRDNKLVYSKEAHNHRVGFDWIDEEDFSKIAFTARFAPQPTAYYYIRVHQEGMHGRLPKMAWSSPIWLVEA